MFNEQKKHIRWEKLDNTAHLFPVISGEDMSNVYRISVELYEQIHQEVLQEALQEAHGEYTFEEVVVLIKESLRAQINKDYLESFCGIYEKIAPYIP